MTLKDFRDEIDKIDDKIISLLEKRFEIINKIKKLKKEMNLEIADIKREEEILQKTKFFYIKEIYKSILENSKKSQAE